MVQQSLNIQNHNDDSETYVFNDESEKYIFIDDKTKNNKIIYMVFDTYMPSSIINYFELIGPNVAMINEDMCLSINLLNEIQNYEYLRLYQEAEKP